MWLSSLHTQSCQPAHNGVWQNAVHYLLAVEFIWENHRCSILLPSFLICYKIRGSVQLESGCLCPHTCAKSLLRPCADTLLLGQSTKQTSPPPYDSQHSSLDTMTCRVISWDNRNHFLYSLVQASVSEVLRTLVLSRESFQCSPRESYHHEETSIRSQYLLWIWEQEMTCHFWSCLGDRPWLHNYSA